MAMACLVLLSCGKEDGPEATAMALRFTMTIPGIDTMIVGTTRPHRWEENARYVAEGNLTDDEYEAIRDRWREAADESWVQMT